MKEIKKYTDYKLNEVESLDIPTDIFNNKSIEDLEKDYELELGHKGLLGQHLEKNGKKFTFGILKMLFKDALSYKKRRELYKGGYKLIHRAVPMATAFFFFPIWLIGNILGASRALNKIVQPILSNPGNNYNQFLIKFIKGAFAVSEGEIKYLMTEDWYYNIFVMDDNLVKMIRKDVLMDFASHLADIMEDEKDDKIVPNFYIENELKKYLNERFSIKPPMNLK